MNTNLFSSSICVLLFVISFGSHAQISFSLLPAQPADHILSITKDPGNSAIIACTSSKVVKSTDNGLTWAALANVPGLGLNVVYVSTTGQLFLGIDATNGSTPVGLLQYNSVSSSWTAISGSPKGVTAITEDNSGNLIIGTGTTGNFNPNPINFGNGAYKYSGSTFTQINSGISNLPGYSVLPSIKSLLKTSSGNIIAATYGNGVLVYNGSTWSTYGTGLANLNVSSLAFDNSGVLYAGVDNGISSTSGATWNNVSTGLPNKPVRALAIDGNNKIYAGLGFYHWMDGSLSGEIYTSSNSGASWQNGSSGLASSDVLSLYVDATNTVFAGASGLWKWSSSGSAWGIIRSSAFGANQVMRIVKNSKGDLFTVCDSQTKYFGYGGVYKSTDNGATWNQLLSGINRHRGSFIFCDSKDNLWAAFSTMSPAASNGSYTNGALYKSTDNGNTWVQSTSILVPSLRFVDMKESSTGKLYVINGFGSPSNISSSSDYNTWDNSLNPSLGGMAFFLAINSIGDVFAGTETAGVIRSVANGTGAFVNVSPTGGNCGVFVDPNTNFTFGVIPNGANGNELFGSIPSDNGTNMFQFDNFPIYASPTSMVFDNRGNLYLVASSGNFANSGFYTAPSPWTATTTFTKVMANANASYYFNSMNIDPCGYVYASWAGVGIYKSSVPINTPALSNLQSPANLAAGISLTPSLTWTHPCTPDSYRLQIATDAAFTSLVKDVTVATANYSVPASTLSQGTYYWRVYAINAAGNGAWTSPFSFTTSASAVFLNVSTNSLNLTTAASSTATFDISSNTAWSVSSNQTWITANATTGSNTSTITLTASSNLNTTSRSATISVSGNGVATQNIVVTQPGASSTLTLTVSAASLNVASAANSTASFGISSNTAWNISSSQLWLIPSAISGSNNSTITLTASANPNTTSRSATITISGGSVVSQTINVTQAPAPGTLSVSTTSLNIASTANSTASFNISSNTSWSVSSDQAWITPNVTSGSNNSTIALTAGANPNSSSRSATITVSGGGVASQVINVIQAAGMITGTIEITSDVIQVFPNPALDEISIKIIEELLPVQYSINNNLGQELISGELTVSCSKISLKGFSPAMYFLILGNPINQKIKFLIKN